MTLYDYNGSQCTYHVNLSIENRGESIHTGYHVTTPENFSDEYYKFYDTIVSNFRKNTLSWIHYT